MLFTQPLQLCCVTMGKSLPLSGLLSFLFSNTGPGRSVWGGRVVRTASEALSISAMSPVLGDKMLCEQVSFIQGHTSEGPLRLTF